MVIRNAKREDMPRICEIYAIAREHMAQEGNFEQWCYDNYPSRELLEDDMKKEQLFVCTEGNAIKAVFVYYEGFEDDYENCVISGEWKDTTGPYGVLHRIAVSESGNGIGSFCMDWCYDKCHNMRGSTHILNKSMQRLYARQGYVQRVELQISAGHRIGFEKGNL